MALETGLLVAGLVLSALASIAGGLIKPKGIQNPLTRRNTSPTLAERGSFIPYVLGTARVGAVVTWVGKPKTKTNETGGYFGFGTTKTKVTTQQAWHCLCVGPANAIYHIWENGKVIFPVKGEVPLTAAAHPSGTKYKLKSGGGTLWLYWGDQDQLDAVVNPVIDDVSKGVGIGSKWPQVCYVVWDTKKLATANVWPAIEYEVEVRPLAPALLTQSTPWMPGVPVAVDSPFVKNNGVNPAHALLQILTQKYPHGIGVLLGDIDMTFAEQYGKTLQEEGQPANVIINNGDDALQTITDIMLDVGGVFPQIADKIVPYLVRLENSTPSIPDSMILPSIPERDYLLGDKTTDRLTFVFKDRLLQFRDSDVTVDDDSVQLGRPKLQKIEMNTVIDQEIAVLVSNRSQQNYFAPVRTFKLDAAWGARLLSPGQSFNQESLGQLRVIAIQRNPDTARVTIECVQDVYALQLSSYTKALVDPGSVTDDPAADILDFIELPAGLAKNQISIAILRVRTQEDIVASLLTISYDDTNYYNLDQTDAFMLTGTINTDWTRSNPFAIAQTGPIITCTNEIDNDQFYDLTNQDKHWQAGLQYLIIGQEICFFKKLVALGSNLYRVDGLIRARHSSIENAYVSGTRCFLCLAEDIKAINKEFFSVDTTVYVKSLPVTGDGNVIDDTLVASVSHALTGKIYAPFPPVDFRVDDLSGNVWNTWAAGAAILLKWANRIRGNNPATAGNQGAGKKIATAVPNMDGVLQITFKTTGGVVKDTVQVLTGTTQSYANATLVAAFGAEPSAFDIDFQMLDGAISSEVQTIRITRR